MEYTSTTRIAAPAAEVWSVLADVQQWPSWTPTVESVDSPVERPEVGVSVAAKQPGRGVVRYTVTVADDGRRFAWENTHAGVRQWADHVVVPDGANACTVELTFAMRGPVGSFVGRLAAGRIRAMVDTEAASLKARVER